MSGQFRCNRSGTCCDGHSRSTDRDFNEAGLRGGWTGEADDGVSEAFAEYNETAGQVLLTKNTMINPVSRENAKNTFDELFALGVIPIVNENDTTSTYEMQFGDNDTLSALVSSMVGADLLILLSDIDGLYTDDPHTNPDAQLVKKWKIWTRISLVWPKVRPAAMLVRVV